MTKTAFIAIVGRPNVGKSTLLNAMIGEKIAIVSKKPQTTRNRILGILTNDNLQYVFLDTPGIHKPQTKLGDLMVRSADSSIGEADGVILVVEPYASVGNIEERIISKLEARRIPTILVINKTDNANREIIAKTIAAYAARYNFDAVIPISALKGDGVDIVLDEAENFMRESVWFFPADMITDQPERQIAAEIIREKLLRTLEDEIPHGTAVMIEGFEETPDMLKIRAEIYCERESHKGIIIGKDGQALKRIGTYAREDMESFFGIKVYLNLWVKVREKWRDSSSSLNAFGYNEK